MKFLIQKVGGKVVHGFVYELIESIKYLKWTGDYKISHRYLNDFYPANKRVGYYFEGYHHDYIPIGSVEFVTKWFEHFHGHTPKPINVPDELFNFANREIWNGTEDGLDSLIGNYFVKSKDDIKGYAEQVRFQMNGYHSHKVPAGNYQVSEITDIESEWRCFVYRGELVGLQNYSGDFTMFPDVDTINEMIPRELWSV